MQFSVPTSVALADATLAKWRAAEAELAELVAGTRALLTRLGGLPGGRCVPARVVCTLGRGAATKAVRTLFAIEAKVREEAVPQGVAAAQPDPGRE